MNTGGVGVVVLYKTSTTTSVGILVVSTDSKWFDGNFCQLLKRIDLQLLGREYQAQVQIHRYSRTKAQLLLNQLFFSNKSCRLFSETDHLFYDNDYCFHHYQRVEYRLQKVLC